LKTAVAMNTASALRTSMRVGKATYAKMVSARIVS
jgi:hypothetical protein